MRLHEYHAAWSRLILSSFLSNTYIGRVGHLRFAIASLSRSELPDDSALLAQNWEEIISMMSGASRKIEKMLYCSLKWQVVAFRSISDIGKFCSISWNVLFIWRTSISVKRSKSLPPSARCELSILLTATGPPVYCRPLSFSIFDSTQPVLTWLQRVSWSTAFFMRKTSPLKHSLSRLMILIWWALFTWMRLTKKEVGIPSLRVLM